MKPILYFLEHSIRVFFQPVCMGWFRYRYYRLTARWLWGLIPFMKEVPYEKQLEERFESRQVEYSEKGSSVKVNALTDAELDDIFKQIFKRPKQNGVPIWKNGQIVSLLKK